MVDSAAVTITRIDSILHCSVKCLTDSVRLVMDQNQPPPTIDQKIGIVALSAFFALTLLVFYCLIKYDGKIRKKEKREFAFNLTLALIGCVLLGILFFALYKFGLLHAPSKHGFFVSHADVLAVIATILAFVGAMWAILARIDAEKAFNESINTRNSFGNSFSFLDIFDEELSNSTSGRIPYIIKQIGEDGFTVSLYIGFPCIGYFYKKNSSTDKDRIDINKIRKNFYALITKLDRITEDYSKECEINLGIFDKEEIKACFKSGEKVEILHKPEGGLSQDHERNLLEDWENVINKIKSKKTSDLEWCKKKKINIIDIKRTEERFRFASVHKDNGHEQRALIWVIPDFYSTNTLEFSSAGFQTSDISIIEMLEKVFEMEKHNPKPMSTPPSP